MPVGAIDSSTNKNHGTFTAAGANVTFGNTGKDGKCFTWAVSASIFAAPNVAAFQPAFNQAWSMSFWWFGALPTTTAFLASTDPSSQLNGIECVTFSGTFYVQFITNTGANNYINKSMATPSLTAGVWHHIAVAYTGSGASSGISVWIDNVLQTMTPSVQSITTTPAYTQPLTCGNRPGTGGLPASIGAKMDMAAFWKGRALTGTDVGNIFGNPTAAYILANQATNLSALYAMDQTTAVYVSLLSATSHDDRISLVFDDDIVGTNPTLATDHTQDPFLTSTSPVSALAVDIMWTLPVPSLTGIKPTHTQLELDFDMPVNAGTPTITPGGVGSPIVSGDVQTSARVVTINHRIPKQNRRPKLNGAEN